MASKKTTDPLAGRAYSKDGKVRVIVDVGETSLSWKRPGGVPRADRVSLINWANWLKEADRAPEFDERKRKAKT